LSQQAASSVYLEFIIIARQNSHLRSRCISYRRHVCDSLSLCMLIVCQSDTVRVFMNALHGIITSSKLGS